MKEYAVDVKEYVATNAGWQWYELSGIPYCEADSKEEAIELIKEYIKDCIRDNFTLTEDEIEEAANKVDTDDYMFTAREV